MKLSISIITKSLLALLIVAGLPGQKAQAQENLAITVTIPFSFGANNQADIPVGTYQISLLEDLQEVVSKLRHEIEALKQEKPDEL